jgi:hypothetical protein
MSTGDIDVSATAVAAATLRFTVFGGFIVMIVSSANFGERVVAFRTRRGMHRYAVGEAIFLLGLAYFVTGGWEKRPHLLRTSLIVVLLVAIFVLVFLEGHEESSDRAPSPGRALVKLIESGYFPLIVAVIVLSFASYWQGSGDAATRTSFFVSKRDPTIVVLRQYGDRYVAARLLKKNVVDETSRIVIHAGDAAASEFVKRKLGRLRFK